MKHLLIMMILCVSSMAQETVAVYPLHSNSVNTTTTDILTEDLTTYIVNTHKFSVVSRNTMMDIAIKEQSLQQNGVFNEDKIVQIGNMTGATILVVGSVENFNGKYQYNVSLINTETGEIINSVYTDKYGTEFIAYSLANERTIHHRDRQPHHREHRKQSGRGKFITRVISGAVGATALFMSIHYSSKANEYKELQGASNFYNSVDMGNNTNDYSSEIQHNETAMGVSLGISAVSFAVCGVTFLF